MIDWNALEDVSGDGRGAPATVGPALLAIPQGGSHTFGPFKTKQSANASMGNYAKRKEAQGITFDGPARDASGFYIRARRL